MQYAGKVVVVTGASAGIGAAVAQEIAARAGSVVLAARTRSKLEEVARGLRSALVVEADVTRRADVERLLAEAVKRFGKVDVWINNAGRGISKPLLELTDDDVDQMIRDNLKSALYGMQVAVRHFQERGEGSLVNVSSMLARTPLAPFRSAYSASKAALNSLTETLRMDLSAKFPNIRVVCVMPGVVATEFGNNALGGGPDSRSLPGAQDVREVARVIADAALTRNGDVYTFPGAAERVLGHVKSLAG